MITAGLTLDAGALVAVERGDNKLRAIAFDVRRAGLPMALPAGGLAQVWRGGRRQARLARLLKEPRLEVVALDEAVARVVGQMCGESGHPDVVNVSVALCARERGHTVVTSDPDDVRRVDRRLPLIVL